MYTKMYINVVCQPVYSVFSITSTLIYCTSSALSQLGMIVTLYDSFS